VAEAHARCKTNSEGKNSEVYPALSRVPSELFGVCLVGASGRLYAAGDTEFSIMSVSKPFVFALVCQELGAEQVRERSEQTPRGCRSTHSPPSNEAKTGEPTQW
jgi:glutaminase